MIEATKFRILKSEIPGFEYKSFSSWAEIDDAIMRYAKHPKLDNCKIWFSIAWEDGETWDYRMHLNKSKGIECISDHITQYLRFHAGLKEKPSHMKEETYQKIVNSPSAKGCLNFLAKYELPQSTLVKVKFTLLDLDEEGKPILKSRFKMIRVSYENINNIEKLRDDIFDGLITLEAKLNFVLNMVYIQELQGISLTDKDKLFLKRIGWVY